MWMERVKGQKLRSSSFEELQGQNYKEKDMNKIFSKEVNRKKHK